MTEKQIRKQYSRGFLRVKEMHRQMNPAIKPIREQIVYRFNMIQAWRELCQKGVCTPTPDEYKKEIARVLLGIIKLNQQK